MEKRSSGHGPALLLSIFGYPEVTTELRRI